MYSNAHTASVNGRTHHSSPAAKAIANPVSFTRECLRTPERTAVRQVAIFYKNQPSPHQTTEAMKRAIDSHTDGVLQPAHRHGGAGVCQPPGTTSGLNRFTLRGQRAKVNAQWHPYCLVHNIEKTPSGDKTASRGTKGHVRAVSTGW